MRRSAWIATTSIATLGLLFALGVVPVELQPRAEAQMSQPPPKDDESLGPVDAALAQEADRLGALDAITQIVNSNPTVFGGVSTTGSSQVAVYVSGNDAVAALPLQQIRRAADTVGVSLTVERRTYSLAELNEVQRRIVEDDALGPAERLVGLEIEVVPARNIVELRVPASLGADFEADARELFGALVEFSPLEDMPMEQDRFNDTSPFYGGNRIVSDTAFPTDECTSGFTLTNLFGQRYQMTSGHCFPNQTFLRTAAYAPYGDVTLKNYPENSNLDNELISGSRFGVTYSGRIWTGGVDNPISVPVRSSRNSCTGCQVYLSGSFSGQQLQTLQGGPYCAVYNSGYSCGLQSTSPGNCQGGDSGAPYFAYDGGGGVIAVGIHKAGSGSRCVYVQVPAILSYWQSTITTG